jgi:hypothetical protein
MISFQTPSSGSIPLQVDTISTSQLLDGSWVKHAALLVMPGGADLPYCKHLNGRGNSIIKGGHEAVFDGKQAIASSLCRSQLLPAAGAAHCPTDQDFAHNSSM